MNFTLPIAAATPGLLAAPAWAADCANGINTANCTVPAGAVPVGWAGC